MRELYIILYILLLIITKESTATLPGQIEEINGTTIEIETETIEFEIDKPSILEEEVFDLINDIRKEEGLNTLEWNSDLYDVAKIRAEEASVFWSHTRPDGSEWYTVSKSVHGENLARKYLTPAETVDAWMNSEGHRENILRENFDRCAIALFVTENGYFWCCSFGY